jgi:CheY-like chemotaxis protein
MHNKSGMTILLADDDEDDCLLVRDALNAVADDVDLRVVNDSEQLIQYLARCCSARCEHDDIPCPQLVLMEVNLPEMNGIQALCQIRSDPELGPIPVVLVTGTTSQHQVRLGYECGANSFITKPSRFDDLMRILKNLVAYWLETVDLPRDNGKEDLNPPPLINRLTARERKRTNSCACPARESD